MCFYFFFFNDTATTEIYTLSLHDALPISATRQGVFRSHIPRVLVVRSILDHELHFVRRLEPIEVRPVVLVGLAAAGALDVDHADDAVRHLTYAQVPARFEHHGAPLVEEPLHQRVELLLPQRPAAGNLDDRA